MSGQNQPQIGPDSEDKPEAQPKKPTNGGKPPRRQSPKRGPRPGHDQFGIEPLPKR